MKGDPLDSVRVLAIGLIALMLSLGLLVGLAGKNPTLITCTADAQRHDLLIVSRSRRRLPLTTPPSTGALSDGR